MGNAIIEYVEVDRMDYGSWVLSIYDRFDERYKDRYITTKKRFKDLSRVKKIQVIITILLMLIGLGVYEYGIFSKNEIVFCIGVFIILVIPIMTIYIDKVDIELFKKQILILEEVLTEEGLNNENAIIRLEKDTQGILGRIKDENVLNLIKSIMGLLSAIGITTALKYIGVEYINKEITVKVIVISLLAMCLLIISYYILLSIPNGKMVRKKQFNQLLRILIVYKGYK
jgi:membrane protein YdbS with pleckstrin-like domain